MFYSLGLVLVLALKCLSSVTKRLKIKVRRSWGLILIFGEVTGEKLLGTFSESHPEYS